MDDAELLETLGAEPDPEERSVRRELTMQDFRFDETQAKFWDMTTGRLLESVAVNGMIKPWPAGPLNEDGTEGRPLAPASVINDIRTGLTVEGATWWPGRPQIIDDIVMTATGGLDIEGARCYNMYSQKPLRDPPEGVTAGKWIEHVKKLWPDPVEHNHFFDYCAHIIQRPDEKVNHGIILSGRQGIGKDSALHPIRHGVGHNCVDVTPDLIVKEWNGFTKSVVMIINEVRPHNEDHKSANFYNVLKPLLASPPNLIAMNVKYQNTIHIPNLVHCFITTNDALTMYIPEEDRRLMVMSSIIAGKEEMLAGNPDYFPDLFRYFAAGGEDAATKWLSERLLDGFIPGDPPPMTGGKERIIDSALTVRRTAMDDVLENYLDSFEPEPRPIVIFKSDLESFVRASNLFDDMDAALKAVAHRNLHYKMAEAGWDKVTSPDSGRWTVGKRRERAVFVDDSIPNRERVNAVLDEIERRVKE